TAKIRIRRGRKFKDETQSQHSNQNHMKDINKNYLHQNEIYEQVDPKNDPDFLQLAKQKKTIFRAINVSSRRIIPYNLHFLKTFRCNHDIQVVTDPWASAAYLFSYVAKNAQMEKNVVYQMSNCTCSSLIEAKSLLLKTGNAVLSHRQIGKVEASWTILGIAKAI
ncbi:unnamed protein product, partial [Rotaria socialis]